MREYQSRTRDHLTSLNTSRDKHLSEKVTLDAKLKTLSGQYLKQKQLVDGLRHENAELSAKGEGLRGEKVRLEREIERVKHDSGFTKGLLEQTGRSLTAMAKKVEEKDQEMNRMGKTVG